LQIADTLGFEAVSMRRVAEALGVGTMTLYYYVRTKNDLLALMEDALMGEVLVSDAEVARPWREAMTAIARATRKVFLQHPWALFVPDGGRVGPNSLKHMEQSIAALGDTSLSDVEKLELIILVDDYVMGHVLRLREPWLPDLEPEVVEPINRFIVDQLAAGEYPELVRMFGDEEPVAVIDRLWHSVKEIDRFERGLQALLGSFDRPL
jgi:AcrR family transcriptional regulator